MNGAAHSVKAFVLAAWYCKKLLGIICLVLVGAAKKGYKKYSFLCL